MFDGHDTTRKSSKGITLELESKGRERQRIDPILCHCQSRALSLKKEIAEGKRSRRRAVFNPSQNESTVYGSLITKSLGKSTWTAHPRVVPGRQLGSARLRKTDSLGVVEQPRLLFYGRPEGICAFLLSFLKVHCVSRPSPGA